MLNFNSILLSSENPERLVAFYRGVLDADPLMDEGGYTGFQAGAGFFTIGPHDAVHGRNQNPERILINFESDDVPGQFERIRGLGATVIAEPYQMSDDFPAWIATFADPDGNYFQLLSPFDPSQLGG